MNNLVTCYSILNVLQGMLTCLPVNKGGNLLVLQPPNSLSPDGNALGHWPWILPAFQARPHFAFSHWSFVHQDGVVVVTTEDVCIVVRSHLNHWQRVRGMAESPCHPGGKPWRTWTPGWLYTQSFAIKVSLARKSKLSTQKSAQKSKFAQKSTQKIKHTLKSAQKSTQKRNLAQKSPQKSYFPKKVLKRVLSKVMFFNKSAQKSDLLKKVNFTKNY